jgi:hypothetical protein
MSIAGVQLNGIDWDFFVNGILVFSSPTCEMRREPTTSVGKDLLSRKTCKTTRLKLIIDIYGVFLVTAGYERIHWL